MKSIRSIFGDIFSIADDMFSYIKSPYQVLKFYLEADQYFIPSLSQGTYVKPNVFHRILPPASISVEEIEPE